MIDPGVTFGAGDAPDDAAVPASCCCELEPGGALCDWGAGSGVLAIAAARLGWAPVTALELDAAAVAVDRGQRARPTGVAVEARAADLTAEAAPWAPTVCANLYAPAADRARGERRAAARAAARSRAC